MTSTSSLSYSYRRFSVLIAYHFVGDICRICKHKLYLYCASIFIDAFNFVSDLLPSDKPDRECLISRLDGKLSSHRISSSKYQGHFPITPNLMY
jgi:hypothetical protein